MQGGYTILTNRRLIWIDAEATPSPGRSCWLHLHSVRNVSKRTAFALQPKVRLELKLLVDAQAVPCAGAARDGMRACAACQAAPLAALPAALQPLCFQTRSRHAPLSPACSSPAPMPRPPPLRLLPKPATPAVHSPAAPQSPCTCA